jgi:hypothetical protein
MWVSDGPIIYSEVNDEVHDSDAHKVVSSGARDLRYDYYEREEVSEKQDTDGPPESVVDKEH